MRFNKRLINNKNCFRDIIIVKQCYEKRQSK